VTLRRLPLVLLGTLALSAACRPSPERPAPSSDSRIPSATPWAAILSEHLDRYPLATAEDLYKLAHQSVFGPAHAVPSRDEARRYLLDELAALQSGPAGEPLLDPLDHEPPLVRLNLRPYVAAGHDPERLLDAFVATANRVRGSREAMRDRLIEAVAVLREGGRAQLADGLEEVSRTAAAGGYPAAHHSGTYRAAYRPAYRVVLRTLLDEGLRGSASAAE